MPKLLGRNVIACYDVPVIYTFIYSKSSVYLEPIMTVNILFDISSVRNNSLIYVSEPEYGQRQQLLLITQRSIYPHLL